MTPEDKNSGNAFYRSGLVQSDDGDGSKVAFTVPSSFGDGLSAPRTSEYLATRASSGWESRNIMRPNPAPDIFGASTELRFGFRWFTADLSAGFFIRNDGPGVARNLHRQDFVTDLTTRITPPPLAALDPFSNLYADFGVADASRDGRRLLFESTQQLTPDAPPPTGVMHLYQWIDGEVEFAGVLPDDSAAPSSMAGRGAFVGFTATESEQRGLRTMTADGSRIFFTVPDGTPSTPESGRAGEVYMREGGQSTHISGSQRTDCAGDPTCGGDGEADPVADPDGEGQTFFATATDDGSFVFLRSCRKLTDESTAVTADCSAGRQALYRYEVATGELEDISVGLPASPLEVEASDDGETLYMIAQGTEALDKDMYLWHEGQLELIGDAFDESSFTRNASTRVASGRTSRVSPDGRYLLWISRESLTGADTGGNFMLYLYDRDAAGDKIRCVSCLSGRAATSSASITAFLIGVTQQRQYEPRALVAGDRLAFFGTRDALVPEDTNGRADVYQYDIATGERRLLSGGSQPGDAYFGDSSPDGKTVFVVTDQRLVAGDRDSQRDVYAVRTNGGFPETGVETTPCQGDRCQGDVEPLPPRRAPSTTELRGRGDVAPAAGAIRVNLARVRPAQLSRLARGGSVRLAVRVSRPGRVRLTARARIGGRPRVVAAATARARSAGAVGVAVRLSRPARRQLSRTGRLRVVVSARMAGRQASRVLALTVGGSK